MREPSIHITKSQFEEILNTLEVDNFPVEAFFVIARKEAINHRAVLVSNNKNTKRVNNILLASKGDAALVADIIYATRIKLKHRGVRKINESNSREWANCKKLAEVCNQFCEDFQLDTREGFIKYIELGIKKMDGNYNNLLNRLSSMSEKISDLYSATLEMEDDSGNAKAIHDYFIKRVADVTGIYESFVNQPDKYIHFVRLDKFLSEKGWDPTQFIDAQFESLAWCNGLPEPSQMYNDKAIERYNKYLFKHKNHSQSEEPKVEGSLWSKINKL
jgi:hypothetical protein